MELLNRYLQAVKAFLPLAQQDDIIDELSENILSQMEDREAELGRPLNQSEMEALLKVHGHPLLLAARYRPQQQLMGPVVLPVYWVVVKAVLALMAVFSIIIPGIVLLASGKPWQEAWQLIIHFPGAALTTFGWLTAEFIALDYIVRKFHLLEKWNEKWSPRSLPAVVKVGQKPRRSESICALAAGAVFLVWWMAVPYFPYLMLGPGSALITFGPDWNRFHLAVFLLSLVGMARQLAEVASPEAKNLLLAMRLARDSAGMILIFLAIRSGPLALFLDASGAPPKLAAIINYSISYSLLLGFSVAAVIQVITWVYGFRRKRTLSRA